LPNNGTGAVAIRREFPRLPVVFYSIQDDDAYYRDFRQSGILSHYAYVRAVDGTGQIHARADSPPVMGFWPTSRWAAGEVVADPVRVSLPLDVPVGPLEVVVGMYRPGTGQCLPVLDAQGQAVDDKIILRRTTTTTK
jgi:hypothetical protein